MRHIFKQTIIRILTWESRMVLKKYHPKIIGVTGSVGKTSTKDALYLALTPFFHVRKSEKSFNSDTGVPLSILGLPNAWTSPLLWVKNIFDGLMLILLPHKYPEVLVLEVGADKPGDIISISTWLKPDVAVITHFPDVPAHIEFFESREHIIKEKSSLALAVSQNGFVVLNADDPDVLLLRSEVSGSVVTYGTTHEAMIQAQNTKLAVMKEHGISIPDGVVSTISYNGAEFSIHLKQVISSTHISSILAAFSVAVKMGGDPQTTITALEKYATPPGRLSPILGKNNSLIIDDTYNASPFAMAAGLETLAMMPVSGRKIAVLGDMLELGKHSIDAHKEVGKLAAKSAELLVTVGVRAKQIGESAFGFGLAQNAIHHCDSAEEAGAYVSALVKPGDVILFKASQGVRLEKAVALVMAHPEEAKNVLVRQDTAWKVR